MSRDHDQSAEALEHIDQLVAHFRSGEKPKNARLRFGTEHEKFVYKKDDLSMLSYDEPGGFGQLFEQLEAQFGWEASRDKGKIVALVKDGAAITLEPGGQLELSGAILNTMFETAQEFDAHIQELKALVDDRLYMTSFGLNPLYGPEQVPWMPKSRYDIMRNYLPTRGDRGIWMMKTTCTVQGNYDYTSEADAVDILRTGLIVSPLISALAANSPIKELEAAQMQTYRCHIWTRTDPDRTGFPEFMFGTDWGYEDYAQYVLDVPMFFIRRDDKYIDMSGVPFRRFMEQGHEGYTATMGDFELHLSTIFPELRMKTYIEVRGADSGSREMILALPAIWKGLLYSPQARRQAADLFGPITYAEHRAAFGEIYREGIHAQTPYGSVKALGERLLNIASAGLDEIAARDGHESEAVFLAPYREILATGKSAADRLLEDFEAVGHDPRALIERHAF